VINTVVQQRFVSLQYELLTGFGADVFVQVRGCVGGSCRFLISPFSLPKIKAIQSFWQDQKEAQLPIQFQQLSRKQVHEQFSGILPMRNTDGFFHVFVSYR